MKPHRTRALIGGDMRRRSYQATAPNLPLTAIFGSLGFCLAHDNRLYVAILANNGRAFSLGRLK